MFISSKKDKENSILQRRIRLLLSGMALVSALSGSVHADDMGGKPTVTASPNQASPNQAADKPAPVVNGAPGAESPKPVVAPSSDKPAIGDKGQAVADVQPSDPPTFKTCPVNSASPSSPAKAGHILVIGDSQAQGLAGGLRWLYRKNRNMLVRDHAKQSTGLVSLESYNWPDEVHKLSTTVHADVAVVFFGANDRPSVRVHGVVDQRALTSFTKVYSARVRDIIVTLKKAHIPVIWIGHPMIRNDTYSDDMKILNTIFQEQAKQNGAEFFPLWTLFSEDGHFAPYGEGVDGLRVRLRRDDGVHLTPEGYDKAAKLLEPVIACYQPSPS